jgi:nucleotide-binding universal stress UspA family protein
MSWLPKKSVVVPVDFSEESFAAVDLALQLVDTPAGVHVVHVLAEIVATEPGVVWEVVDDQSRREHAEAALGERLSDAKYKGIRVHIEFGDPGHQIADFAAKVGAQLVVLPSHGRRGLARLMIGSVAERVVRLCHCPVLVLRK